MFICRFIFFHFHFIFIIVSSHSQTFYQIYNFLLFILSSTSYFKLQLIIIIMKNSKLDDEFKKDQKLNKSMINEESEKVDLSKSFFLQSSTSNNSSINSNTSKAIEQSNNSTSKTSKKRKFKMINLNDKNKELLIQEFKAKPQENKNYKNIKFDDRSLQVEYIVKYLHSYVRFEILRNNFFNLTLKSFSIKSTKSTSNSQITKHFVEIIKNSAKHKVWRIKKVKSEFFKSKVDTSAYITISDKKNDNTNWTLIENFEKMINQIYFITNIMSSIINIAKVWMIEQLNDKYKRKTFAKKMTNQHSQWKVQTHITYKEQCRVYILKRINWKNKLLQETARYYHKYYWSTNLSIDEIMRLANSKSKYLKNVLFENDSRDLMKQENMISKKDEIVCQIFLDERDL